MSVSRQFVVSNHELPRHGHEDYSGQNMDLLRRYDYDQNGTSTPPDIVNSGPSGCPETTYSFDYENTHFVVLNVYCDTGGDTVTSGDVPDDLYDWLNADLQATTKKYIFVFGHEPAFPQPDADNGRLRHQNDSLNQFPGNRDRFWNLLRDEGVVAYICGHTHNYSAYYYDGIWQLDAGHARGEGDTGAASTFLMIHVEENSVTFDAYRDLHDGIYDYDDIIHSGTLFDGTDVCPHPIGHWDYCKDCGPCIEGQGDCDTDNECASGLVCDQITGAVDLCKRPCPHPIGHGDYCRDCGPCSEGQGDCDGAAECESGLICAENVGADYGWASTVDVCEAPTVCPHPIGHWDYCKDCGPCTEGQGDCDSNGECAGDLICDFVPGTDYCSAPGCTLPLGHLDYCRECGPCAAGEGDCDSNSECQSGLSCVFVPGTDVCCPHPLGHLDYCRDCGPCREGQGDCDNDGECQIGLTCVLVPGTDTCQ